MKKLLFYLVMATIVFSACENDEAEDTTPISTRFISEASIDGYVVNSPTKAVYSYYSGGQGKEIPIGWDANGYAMRGFISFDITSILPSGSESLVIDEAILKVYEANTNLNPFSGDGNRSVQCYLVDFQALDASDYNAQTIANCGIIASTGYSVLTEHPLIITSSLSDLIKSYPSTKKIQFRLQWSSDNNVTTSTLKQAMWNIFSGDETGKADYKPVLAIKYHFEKK